MNSPRTEKALFCIRKNAARASFWRLAVWSRWFPDMSPGDWDIKTPASPFLASASTFVFWLVSMPVAVAALLVVTFILGENGWVSEATFAAIFPTLLLSVGAGVLALVVTCRILNGLSPADSVALGVMERVLRENPELMDTAVVVTGDAGPVRVQHVAFLNWAACLLNEARHKDHREAMMVEVKQESPNLGVMDTLREKARLNRVLSPATPAVPGSQRARL